MLKEPESPRRPDADNDTRPVSGKGNDRLLLWCLVASLFINFGFGLWMNLADVYGTQRTKEEVKRAPIHVYKPPPIKKKPPPPKPPKPKIPPKPVKMIHPPKPTPQPRPHPSPPHYAPVHIGSHVNSPHAGPSLPPDVPAPPAPAAPTLPDAPPTPQTPAPPAPPPYVPPAPVYHAPPAPPAPPPHRDPPKPSNWQPVDSRGADVTGIDAPDPNSVSDPTQVTGSCVVSFEVSENGRISGARVKKSSGSHEFDQLCVEAVEKAHGVYAIQDHIPYAQRAEQTFSQ